METHQIEDGIRCQFGDGAKVIRLFLRNQKENQALPVDNKIQSAANGTGTNNGNHNNGEFALTLPSGFRALVAGSIKRCPVCFCVPGGDGSNFVILPCKHVYCKNCYESWLTGDTHREFPINCLAEGCSQPLRLADLAATLVPKEMTKLLRASLDSHVVQNSDRFRFCESPNCAGIIECNGGTFSGMCSTCVMSFCFECEASHESMTCKDYRLATLPPDQIRMKIIEEILTLRCPRCKQAFLDFDGCFALTCGTCGCAFCGWCLQDCGDDSHPHANTCAHMEPGANGYHGTFELFQSAQNKRRKKLLLSFLDTLSPSDREKALRSVHQDLKDLGLNIN